MTIKNNVSLAKIETTNGVEVIEGEILNKELTPMDPAHLAITTDEYAGQGGTYLFDPATGKRTPVLDDTE